MNLQLKNTKEFNQFCFVTDASRKKNSLFPRGVIIFQLEFVKFDSAETENIPMGKKKINLEEFALWWKKNSHWEIVATD